MGVVTPPSPFPLQWSLAKNEAGHYYYCTANPNMTLKDLPPVDDVAVSLVIH